MKVSKWIDKLKNHHNGCYFVIEMVLSVVSTFFFFFYNFSLKPTVLLSNGKSEGMEQEEPVHPQLHIHCVHHDSAHHGLCALSTTSTNICTVSVGGGWQSSCGMILTVTDDTPWWMAPHFGTTTCEWWSQLPISQSHWWLQKSGFVDTALCQTEY